MPYQGRARGGPGAEEVGGRGKESGGGAVTSSFRLGQRLPATVPAFPVNDPYLPLIIILRDKVWTKDTFYLRFFS